MTKSALILVILASSMSISSAPQTSKVISSSGLVHCFSQVDVIVDFSEVIGLNNLSLGVNIGHGFDFAKWRNDGALREKTAACNFRLIRLFLHEIQPCIYWNETQHTGEYDWRLFDKTIERVLEIGAEPLLVVAAGNYDTGDWLPKGMEGNYQGSKFPSNESFGAFCVDLVRHANVEKKWNIRYWEVWNEPRFYSVNEATGKAYVDLGRIANFTKVFNNAAKLMHDVDSSILIGHGYSAIQRFFDYFVENALGFGFVSYHDYETHATPYYYQKYYKDESEIIKDASIIGYYKPGIWKTYSPAEIRQKWMEKREEQIPILITETNMNSAYINGTDPRMQTIFGAIWYTEKLRAAILADVSYSAYFILASDRSPYWNTTEPTKGYGFGMLNSTPPYIEWYPYWTNCLVGNHLYKGDKICLSSTSNFTAISTLGWISKGYYNILLIGKTTEKVFCHVTLQNLDVTRGTEISMCEIGKDYNGIRSTNQYCTGSISIIMNGYSLILIKIPSQ